jgi:hypothetical protein
VTSASLLLTSGCGPSTSKASGGLLINFFSSLILNTHFINQLLALTQKKGAVTAHPEGVKRIDNKTTFWIPRIFTEIAIKMSFFSLHDCAYQDPPRHE